jgi:hypothetical protein
MQHLDWRFCWPAGWRLLALLKPSFVRRGPCGTAVRVISAISPSDRQRNRQFLGDCLRIEWYLAGPIAAVAQRFEFAENIARIDFTIGTRSRLALDAPRPSASLTWLRQMAQRLTYKLARELAPLTAIDWLISRPFFDHARAIRKFDRDRG